MKARWLRAAARLYPMAWRGRYAREFEALLEGVEPRWKDVVDVLRGAAAMQMRRISSYLKLVGAVAAAGAVLAVAVSFLWPGFYLSSAVIRRGSADDPQATGQIQAAFQQALSRRSLAELIQQPKLDLYKSERQRKPLEDVIEVMKRHVRFYRLKDEGAPAFRIDFQYGDRYKAQGVVDALTKKVIAPDSEHWIAGPASLADTPVKVNRLAFLFWGLAAGLITGIVLSLFRWRTRWTLTVAGFGLAGCAVAAGLSLLIPNRYVSRSMLRVIPPSQSVAAPPGSDSRPAKKLQTTEWLQRKTRDVLSDASLAEIIQRPTLDLYRKQRAKQPLETVIANMRRSIQIENLPADSDFVIWFSYPDRFKAHSVVSALAEKFMRSQGVAGAIERPSNVARPEAECAALTGDRYVECITSYLGPALSPAERLRRRRASESIDVLDPASLPETPAAPNRWTVATLGLLTGLLMGTLALRYRPLLLAAR